VLIGLIVIIIKATPRSAPSSSASSGSTPSSSASSGPAPSSPTSLLPAKATIFRDNFSSHANQWTDTVIQVGNGGQYYNGTYRIILKKPPYDIVIPKKASKVHPSAPPNIRIKVSARIVPGSVEDKNAGYGVFCRAPSNGGAYLFAIGGGVADIVKYSSNGGLSGLREGNYSEAGVNGYNLLQAQCTNEGQGVHLVFWVNGKIVAQATDTHNPLTTGTVGLAVASTEKVNKPAEAQFDNFTVTQVQGSRS
jgi:hypothetical protein